MRRIVFDIETEGIFSGALPDPKELEVTVVGVHDSSTNEFSSFFKDELHKLWPLFEHADALVGYNSDHFDIPILNKYYPGDLTTIRSIDLLKEVKKSLGRRLRLDNLAEATLGRGKSASGKQAGEWWAQGEREKVRDYCLDDVKITLELYEYAKKHGSVRYKDFDLPAGKADGVREIKLDTSGWEKQAGPAQALTHTLPF